MKVELQAFLLLLCLGMAGCTAEGDDPGLEYAPQMYHSIPYEPLTQIRDKDAGTWLSSLENGVGEFYNSNPHNPYGMNERVPPAHTVSRTKSGKGGNLPYRIPPDSIEYASRVLENPLDSTEAIIQEGHELYNVYCYPCHGGSGKGDGPVAEVYLGVPSYSSGRVSQVSGGHIFHVITYGTGRMNPHGTQVSIEERWKIVRFVQVLQQQEN